MPHWSNHAAGEDSSGYPVNPKYCGRDWQLKYLQFHDSVMTRRAPPDERKFVVSVPVRAGGADNMLGIISLFLYSLIINRAFLKMKLTLEGHHAVVIDHAYSPATFNWTAPDFDVNITSCHWPPYYDKEFLERKCKVGPMPWLPDDPKNYTFHHYYMINSFEKDRFWRSDYNTMLGQSESKKDAIFLSSNRGNVYMAFYNPHHNATLVNDFGFKKETAFACIFNYLFKLKPHACPHGCQSSLSRIRKIKRSRKLLQITPFPIWSHMVIAIQIRSYTNNPDNVWFHCADQLTRDYAASGVHNVTFILISANSDTQRIAREKYGDSLLLPSGDVEGAKDLLDETDKSDASSPAKISAMLESARDWEVMSHADVHIVTRDSGFGVMGAMLRVRDPVEYRLFANHPDTKSNCKMDRPDSLISYATAWSGL